MSLNKKGADISKWQGEIDFKALKGNVDFIILRGGYGLKIDEKFKEYAKCCECQSIPFGVYWYSYAKNSNDVYNETSLAISLIKDYKLDWPVYFDWEDESTSHLQKSDAQNIARLWCNAIEKAGYFCGIYTNKNYYVNKFGPELFNRYNCWLADWNNGTAPSYNCGMHQYTNKGSIKGVNTNVDLDKAEDLASVIKKAGLNRKGGK